MTTSREATGGHGLVKAVEHWLRREETNQELKSRVAAALSEIEEFTRVHRMELDKRKSRLLQTSGYKDETRRMEAALTEIHQLLGGRRNVSRIFVAIDSFLDIYKGEETFPREHIRVQLADARDEQMSALQDSIPGTRLAELLDVLYFLPYSFWRSRAVETRNYRSPSAAEVLKLLEELGRQGVDVDATDPVQLAVILRIKLGITPRMDYHRMPANKLAEKLTGEATVSRHTSRELPLSPGFCRAVAINQANIRRWSAELFGSRQMPLPAEIEAEMLQIVYLSADTIRISGTEQERSADYLWLLATVIASDHPVLKDALAKLADGDCRHPAVRERVAAAKRFLDESAVLADAALVSRWSEAKRELGSLTQCSDAIVAKSTHEYDEVAELEELKEKRSDSVKSLIKISEAIQLLEPSLCDLLTSSEAPVVSPSARDYLRVHNPAKLRDRNYKFSEETKGIARHELDKLRQFIGQIGEIGRTRLAAAVPATQEPQRVSAKPARTSSDGVDLGTLRGADLDARLQGSLVKAAISVRELKDKVEAVRRRSFKSETQIALNQLYGKMKRAAETCDGLGLDGIDAGQAPSVSESVVLVLRDIMAAQASLSTRVSNAKLPPAEKQPLVGLTNAIKVRLGENLRDLGLVRAELAGRAAAPGTEPCAGTSSAADTGDAEGGAPPDRGDDSRAEAALVAASDPLGRVRMLMTRLSRAMAVDNPAPRELLAAALELQDAIAGAQDTAADQLSALARETGIFLQATACAAAVEEAARTVAVLEKSLADALQPLSGKKVKAGELVPIRERCAEAHATTELLLKRLPYARDALAAATSAEWRIFKAAAGYLERLGSDLTSWETVLKDKHSRIRRYQTLLLR